MKLHEIDPSAYGENVFEQIGKDWMLITAEREDCVNTMTASWGGMGVLWGKNVVYIVIRPQRFTKEFVDHSDTFSISFFDESYRKELALCGKYSGRDTDKLKECGFTVTHIGATPVISQAKLSMTCKKLFCQQIKPENFIDPTIDDTWYKEKDYHYLYVGEIVKILEIEN